MYRLPLLPQYMILEAVLMKITGVETIILRYEVKNPVSDSLHTYDAGCTLVTKVLTDEGITGYATTYF